ncbi:hypothetical protein [Blastococcus sp. KM273129]|uniref:hypothetical protein n=1 Tax=Blastococcus sp. KM273129 TaxID=2570315 RepID=UPI001F3CC7DC|nr:hypothetical protein [Blastococcus sp. KM273129]MCF6736219.1 hypothetical protein [Blastococcus sp. KM273129]
MALVELVGLLADAARANRRSGVLQVLRGPGMPPFTQQRAVAVGGRSHLLDAAYDDVLLPVEMDGAAWHGSREQRERDIRRDVALPATEGWQRLRSSYRRLSAEPEECRRENRSVHAARRIPRDDGR